MAPRKAGLSQSDIDTITLTIEKAIKPLVAGIARHEQELYGPDGKSGLRFEVSDLSKHRTKMVGYVIAGAILLPLAGWAAGQLFK